MIREGLYILRQNAEHEARNLRQLLREKTRDLVAFVDDMRETKRLLRARADMYEDMANRERERADTNKTWVESVQKLYRDADAERTELQKKLDDIEEAQEASAAFARKR